MVTVQPCEGTSASGSFTTIPVSPAGIIRGPSAFMFAKPIGWQDAAAVGRMVVDGACLIVTGGEAVDVDLEEVELDFRVLLVI